MAMTRRDRFRLKSQVVDALTSPDWPFQHTNLLLAEFGLQTLDDGSWNGPTIGDVIADVPDATLVEMYSLVLDVDIAEVEDAVESTADDGSWKRGYARVFLSHSAVHKRFVGDVANELAVAGIHGFVAHDTMQYSKPWQAQIEKALRSMQAFVAIVHPEFNDSAWCHQEAGWALGRRVPHYAIRMGSDPAGFVGSNQWPSCHGQTAKQAADIITSWVVELPELGSTALEGLMGALEAAGDYVSAGAAASRLTSLDSLTPEQFARLDRIWWSNDQLHTGVLATREMEPFYRANGRDWPPPRPQAPQEIVPDDEDVPF
jgi:hypothetical protein